MKIIVKEQFIDRYNGTVYRAGETLEFDDAERVDDLVKRGLVKACEQAEKKPVKRTRKAKS